MAKSVVPKHIIKFIPPRSKVANLSYKEREALAVDWDSFSPEAKSYIAESTNDTMCRSVRYEPKDPDAFQKRLSTLQERLLAK